MGFANRPRLSEMAVELAEVIDRCTVPSSKTSL